MKQTNFNINMFKKKTKQNIFMLRYKYVHLNEPS